MRQLDTTRKSSMVIMNKTNLVVNEMRITKVPLSAVRLSKLQSLREEDSPLVKILQACFLT